MCGTDDVAADQQLVCLREVLVLDFGHQGVEDVVGVAVADHDSVAHAGEVSQLLATCGAVSLSQFVEDLVEVAGGVDDRPQSETVGQLDSQVEHGAVAVFDGLGVLQALDCPIGQHLHVSHQHGFPGKFHILEQAGSIVHLLETQFGSDVKALHILQRLQPST